MEDGERMTAKTLEEEARMAASARDFSGHCAIDFVEGYAAAARQRDKEIEELRARVKELEEYGDLCEELIEREYSTFEVAAVYCSDTDEFLRLHLKLYPPVPLPNSNLTNKKEENT
jgi:asparagine synthetase B (glutamine-hydrolysing)